MKRAPDQIDRAIAAVPPVVSAPQLLVTKLPLPSGRTVAFEYPENATSAHLMYAAAWLLLEAPKELANVRMGATFLVPG